MKTGLLVILAALGSGLVYAQSPGTFSVTGSMIRARWGHTATLLDDGRVSIWGTDDTCDDDHVPDHADVLAEVYDPLTQVFAVANGTVTPPVPGVVLRDGKVLVLNRKGLRSAELYDPFTGIYTTTGDMIEPYYDYGSPTLLADGRVLFLAGGTFRSPTDQLYDPATGTFSETGRMRVLRSYYSTTLLPDGRVLVTGGYLGGALASAELYDPATGTFSATGNMAYSRAAPTATLLPDGTVLISGGLTSTYTGDQANASAELYDPSTGTFTMTGSMSTGRSFHTATLLNNGRVLIAGGWQGCNSPLPLLSSAEIYSPTSLVPAPRLYSVSGDDQGQGAILHANTPLLASSGNPATADDVLEIYGTGLLDGSVIPPVVSIGGRVAEIVWFGNAPGWPGLNQVDIRVPRGLAPGSAVPVVMHYLNRSSNTVTTAVQ